MKSALYEIIKTPEGGWSVKEIKKEGIMASFPSREKAVEYLKKISVTEPKQTPVTLDIGDPLSESSD